MFIEFTIIIHTSNNSKVTREKRRTSGFHLSRLKSREKQQLGRGSQAKSKDIFPSFSSEERGALG